MVVGLRHDRSKSNFYQKYMLMIYERTRLDDHHLFVRFMSIPASWYKHQKLIASDQITAIYIVLFGEIYRPNRLWLRNTKRKSSLNPQQFIQQLILLSLSLTHTYTRINSSIHVHYDNIFAIDWINCWFYHCVTNYMSNELLVFEILVTLTRPLNRIESPGMTW